MNYKESFDKDGFVVLENFISVEEAENLLKEIKKNDASLKWHFVFNTMTTNIEEEIKDEGRKQIVLSNKNEANKAIINIKKIAMELINEENKNKLVEFVSRYCIKNTLTRRKYQNYLIIFPK